MYQEFCSQGGVCPMACWDILSPPDQEQTPRVRGRHPTLRDQEQSPPPPPRDQEQTVRPVRILLECILVWYNFCRKLHEHEINCTERGRVSLVPPLRSAVEFGIRVNHCLEQIWLLGICGSKGARGTHAPPHAVFGKKFAK